MPFFNSTYTVVTVSASRPIFAVKTLQSSTFLQFLRNVWNSCSSNATRCSPRATESASFTMYSIFYCRVVRRIVTRCARWNKKKYRVESFRDEPTTKSGESLSENHVRADYYIVAFRDIRFRVFTDSSTVFAKSFAVLSLEISNSFYACNKLYVLSKRLTR